MPSDMRAIDRSVKDPIDDRLEDARDDLDLDREKCSDSEESEKSAQETNESLLLLFFLVFVGFLVFERPLSSLLALLATPGGAE